MVALFSQQQMPRRKEMCLNCIHRENYVSQLMRWKKYLTYILLDKTEVTDDKQM